MYGTKLQTGGGLGTWLIHVGRLNLAAVVAVCLFASTPAFANADLGTWLNTDRKGKIELRECGEKSLCGQLVWLKDPLDEKGKPWRDLLNPDPNLRTRPVVGVDVLIGTKKIGPKTWQGQIYDPEVGKIYYLKHLKVGKDKVEIKGCLSSGWPCRTKYWTRSEPVNPPAPPFQNTKRTKSPKPDPGPVTAPRETHPMAVAPPAPVAPPVQPQIPTQSRPPQAVAPAPPVSAARPIPPDVTAALPGPATSPSGGGYLVQVAARKSHNEALQAYNDLQRQYPRLLGEFRPEVIRADLGQRGIWYRVGVGPMAQQSVADDFCQQLKAVGADCLIRRR